MQARDVLPPFMPEGDIPGPALRLRRCRNDEIEAVRQLPMDDDGPRKQRAFSIDLGPDVFANACPPNIAFRHERRPLITFVQLLLQDQPLPKLLEHTVEVYRAPASQLSEGAAKIG